MLNSIRRRGDNDGEVEGLQVLSIVDARNGARRRGKGHDTLLGDLPLVSRREKERERDETVSIANYNIRVIFFSFLFSEI